MHHIPRHFLVPLVLAICSCTPTSHPPATQPTTVPVVRDFHAPAAPQDIPGVPNFGQVDTFLYRGGQPTREGFIELKRRGVKTIVNMRDFTASDRDELKGLGLNYVHIPCFAWNISDDQIVKFLKVAEDPANQPVFLHCQHGADRTGVSIAVYRILYHGWTRPQAIDELKTFGFHTMWAGISNYLRSFDPEKLRAQVRQTAMPKIEPVE